MMSIHPYLCFDGRCEEAADFYSRALGAEVLARFRFSESPEPEAIPPGQEEKIMHMTLRIGDAVVMASDGHCRGQASFEGFSLSINLTEEKKARELFSALTEGGEIEMPLERTFFSPLFGMVKDRFGVSWMIHVEGEMEMK